jgi:hypothetical protein
MTARDVERLRWQLTMGSEAAARLCSHLEDLHSLAWEKHIGDFEHVAGGADHPGVETVGDLRARTLWSRLCATATDLDTLIPLERAIANYFTLGPSPDPSRGAIVSKGEFGAAQRHQRQRAAAGEYTPTRIEDQPGYGGMGR